MLGEVLKLYGSFLVRVGVLQTVFELEWLVFLPIRLEKKFVVDLKHLQCLTPRSGIIKASQSNFSINSRAAIPLILAYFHSEVLGTVHPSRNCVGYTVARAEDWPPERVKLYCLDYNI